MKLIELKDIYGQFIQNSLKRHGAFLLTVATFLLTLATYRERCFRLVVPLRREDNGRTWSPLEVLPTAKYSTLSNENGKQPCLNKACKHYKANLSIKINGKSLPTPLKLSPN
jgi:hypothetical protein